MRFKGMLAFQAAYTVAINTQRHLLRLVQDNSFRIAVFSDLHYGEDESSFGIAQDIKSTQMFHHVLDAEYPDFVVLNGDLITGENTFSFNSTKYLDNIVQPLIEGGYSWASTYGNHDSKFNLTRENLLAKETKYPNSFTQHGPADTDGVSNFVLPIFGLASSPTFDYQLPLDVVDTEEPLALLYFLDSRGGSQHDHSNSDNIPNFVTSRTAAWLNKTHHSYLARYGSVPSLLFVHIPVQAFLDLQNSAANVSGPHYPGLNADVIARQGDGAVGPDRGSYRGQDIPFMQTMLEMQGLHSVFSGHDHGDSWCGLWPDDTNPSHPTMNEGESFASNGRPFLCFCKHSGFGGYGKWNRGVRMIELAFVGGEMQVKTWVRMQWGQDHAQVVTSVGLNATYGVDEYPTEDGGWRTD